MIHLALAGIFCIPLLLPPPIQEPILYAPTTVGAKYVYKTISRTNNIIDETSESVRLVRKVANINNSTGKLVSLDFVIDGKVADTVEIEVSERGLAYVGFDGRKLRSPFQLLKLPTKAKGTWGTVLTWEDGLELDVECTNEGIETVEVPAGKFRAVRVKAECVHHRKDMCATTWFAIGVGPIKCHYTLGKESFEITLTSFTLGKESKPK